MAAGDIACNPNDPDFNGGQGTASACKQLATSDLLFGADLVLALGDTQYEDARLSDYLGSYDLSWGRFKAITRPVPGNHEYDSPGAAGYYDYFGAIAGDRTKGYYSFDQGAWHFVALNTECAEIGGCGPGSPQEQWLRADLAASTAPCTLAYAHHPLFTSSARGPVTAVRPLFEVLVDHGVDLVLVGHDHHYERFAPQDENGTLDPSGIRQIIVGTGGKHLRGLSSVAAHSEARNTQSHGVLRLELGDTGYDWSFLPIAGSTFTDTGEASCHGADADAEPPSAPSGLTAEVDSAGRVQLGWIAANDDRGVAGYQVERNGTPLPGVPTGTSFLDATAPADTELTYRVRAYDTGGNWSAFSDAVVIRTPPAGEATFLFADDFETGTLAAWTFSSGVVTTAPAYVASGTAAARFSSTGGASYAWTDVGDQSVLHVRFKLKVVSIGSNSLIVSRIRTGTGGGVLMLYRNGSGRLTLRNDVTGTTITSTVPLAVGQWYDIELRAVSGSSGETAVWIDGVEVPQLTGTQNLGSAPMRRVQIGESSSGRTYDLAIDDVVVAPSRIGP